MMTIRCPHCGTANRTGSNFCNSCGTDLRTVEATEVRPTELSSPPDDGVTDLPEPTEGALRDDWRRDAGEELAQPPIADRLISGVQGLLEPLGVANQLTGDGASATPSRLPPALGLDNEQMRLVRAVMTQDPPLPEPPAANDWRPLAALRIPWVFALLGLAVGLPIFLLYSQPVGQPQQWPGVAEAYATVQNLAADAPVLILWAYDPATADEMDLVALPLVSHLLERQSRPVIVTLMPTGLASARRLFARAAADQAADPTLNLALGGSRYAEIGFLSGGALALPLLGQNSWADLPLQDASSTATLAAPTVAIVIAAQAETVQQWLELVQPLNQTPVVAFVSAGADPLLRVYLDGGQLSGLVSGFDGAYSYQQLRNRPLSRLEEQGYRLQLVFQNWGHLAFLVIILLGNLAALLAPRASP
ncbi:MAG: zinc ribbon domain-containing protein [Chloroflexota bacterium]|nr:zinc ribbon domain-containing protein [Chloroflexota bacterium]